MTPRNPIETNNAPPTDESLVDYLLGESTDSDAIQRWLADDASHLLRLEGLAEVVCAVARDAALTTVRPVSESHVFESHVFGRRALVVLATLAASIALIVVWSRQRESNRRLTNDRLAVAWADLVFGDDVTHPLSVDYAPLWLGDGDALPTETSVDSASDWSADNESIAAGEFAAGDDSPPHWLLVAVSQMATESPVDPPSGGDRDALNEEEVR